MPINPVEVGENWQDVVNGQVRQCQGCPKYSKVELGSHETIQSLGLRTSKEKFGGHTGSSMQSAKKLILAKSKYYQALLRDF